MAEPIRVIEWRAAEYEHSEKTTLWYVGLVIAAIALIGIALWQQNFFFGVFVLIAGVIVFLFADKKPSVFDFRVDDEGVTVGGRLFHYGELNNFAVHQRPGKLDAIVIHRNVNFNPHLMIPADMRTINKVRMLLAEKLPEVEYNESIIEIFSDLLGF